jgi:two-component system alkaline phosphatase synthesis response regulator PhoP
MHERLCLVEDDPTISELVGEKLQTKGYAVDIFDAAEAVLAKTSGNETPDWDLYILDILLSGRTSGIELCQHLRKLSPTVPILLLSALSEPSDRVEGLRSGADDYLSKPFEMEELCLRVDGMLKRRSWYGRLPKEQSVFTWEDNSVNFLSLEARHGATRFLMSQKECMLMKLLVEKENLVVSRDEILNQIWGYNVFPSARTVDNFILRLRKYFEPLPKEPKYIHSVRGLGYKFTSRPS